MDDFNNIGTNILWGAAISAGATERQTKEITKKLQEASEASGVASLELAAAIREQNYLLSLNEDERKEYFRQKRELEEKRRQEAEQEAEKRRQREIYIREEKQRQKAEQKDAIKNIVLGVVVMILVTAVIWFIAFGLSSKNTEETVETVETLEELTPDNVKCKHCGSIATECSGLYFLATGERMNVTTTTKYDGTVYTYYICKDCDGKTMYYVHKKGD